MGNHSYSLIDPSTSYSQLPNSSQRPVLSDTRKQPAMSLFASSVALAAFLASLLVLVFLHQSGKVEKVPAEISSKFVLRGLAMGVSDKSSFGPPLGLNKVYGYNWSNAMLSWQRTAYHFQPEKNWMNGMSSHAPIRDCVLYMIQFDHSELAHKNISNRVCYLTLDNCLFCYEISNGR